MSSHPPPKKGGKRGGGMKMGENYIFAAAGQGTNLFLSGPHEVYLTQGVRDRSIKYILLFRYTEQVNMGHKHEIAIREEGPFNPFN